MKPVVLVVMVVVAGVLAAGCGGDASCEAAVDNVLKLQGMGGASYGGMRAQAIEQCKKSGTSAALRSCVASAKRKEDLARCDREEAARKPAKGPIDAYQDYLAKSKRVEAELNLHALEKALKVAYLENAAFPAGSAGLTPKTPCCEGPKHKCAPDPAAWQGNVWEQLDFEVMEPGYFQYAYESDGKTATARAIGDLDCDGITVEYTLKATASASGDPVFERGKPERPD